MRWLLVTLALLGASSGLVVWIYLRDRDTSGWRPPEGQLARADAASTLTALGGGGCRPGCSAKLLGRGGSHAWVVRVTVRGRAQCLRIDLDTFAVSAARGLTGVRPSHC